MKEVDNKYKCIPFWSWNDELDEEKLCEQIEWMKSQGVGGFFMHARGGLKTEYLGEKWFSCIRACLKKAKELNMEAYAYDENGWPSGFVGGKLLEDIENHDMYIEYKTGKYDDKATVSYDLSKDILTKTKSGENCLNIYIKYAASTVDILNPQVVDKFIKLTHEEYKKRDGEKLLKGFFTDEPQYYRWGVSYTKMLEKYFREKYGEDIFDSLGLLFVEKEGFREFRYKYYSALADMIQNNFAKRVYTWCDKNGYKLTGHYIEETSLDFQMCCCGGVMPLYQYEHIPGIDHLGRTVTDIMPLKQLASVCAQTGKEQVLSETFALCGWDVLPNELRIIAESQYVYGVNIMCQHLLPYSEYGQRKRDFPAHFSKINPWVEKDFKTFNDYFSVLGEILVNSKEKVNVAILSPIKSAYMYYDKTKPNGGKEVFDLDIAFKKTMGLLSSWQIPYHLIDETILSEKGSVKGDKLICGLCQYDIIVLPKIYGLDKTTNELLYQYTENGGKIILMDESPKYSEGKEYDFSFIASDITFEEIKDKYSYVDTLNGDIRSTYRVDNTGREFIYIINLGEKEYKIKLNADCKSFENYDILNDSYKVIDKTVSLKAGQSRILYFSDKDVQEEKESCMIKLNPEFSLDKEVDNYYTLDRLSYSTDGKEYSETLNYMGVFNELLKKRYKGKLYLKYSFNVKFIPKKCVAIMEKPNVISVTVNGRKCHNSIESSLDKQMMEADIAKDIKIGNNEIIILMDYYQKEEVYYALFGENVTESLKNCLVYDSNIECVYLKGNFGVYGDFVKGNKENVISGNNFYLFSQPKEVTCLIENGFPFFRGEITLTQKIRIKDKRCKLYIDKRFHILEVYVNNRYAGKMMFDNEIDISDYVETGMNTIKIKLYIGNRNLFGPFHDKAQENFFIGPDSFEHFNSWTNGKSSEMADEYAFVKSII